MKFFPHFGKMILVFLSAAISLSQSDCVTGQALGTPSISFSPETYVVYRAHVPLEIDGKPDEESWERAEWTNAFVDIQGHAQPEPRYKTRVKMLWDDDYFYFAAEMEEPHVWATLTEYDSVIFYDNDFEVFIDPNGDTHHYYELEVNAFGTIWDLMLTRPYRNGGRAIDAWDIKGLKAGIDIQGTINDPADIDTGWTVELAIPWDVLEEASPSGRPSAGDQWRVNFSRVQWQTEVIDGEYVKKKDPETGDDLPEDNWVWSPQGVINMHYPEMWGFVQFSDIHAGESTVDFNWRQKEEDVKWLLRNLYYRQVDFYREHGKYTDEADQLGYRELFEDLMGSEVPPPELKIQALDANYLMRISGKGIPGNWYIRQDSKVWGRQ